MEDKELYEQSVGLKVPWSVERVERAHGKREVRVHVEYEGPPCCRDCCKESVRYGSREREWRHLDTCQYETVLVAQVARVKCEEHGAQQVSVSWAEPRSRCRALFESLVIGWLQEASISAVAKELRLRWDEVDTIMQRAVRRGLERREARTPRKRGVDETSF